MGETFGTRWFDKFGTDPSETWKEELGRLKADQIRGAMGRIRHHRPEYEGWMPSLVEFMGFARNFEVTRTAPGKPAFEGDNIDLVANRLMLHYLWRKGGCSAESSKRLWKIARKLSADYRLIITEEKVTNGEFQDALEAAWNKVWEPPLSA